MALMNCPECGKEVSDNAVNCVHCGSPLVLTNNPFAQKVSPARLRKNKKIGKILGIIIVALIFLAVILAIIGSNETGDKSPANELSVEETTQTVSPSPEIEYIEITATELIEAYDENEVSADNNFKNQMLRITGTVSSIGKDI